MTTRISPADLTAAPALEVRGLAFAHPEFRLHTMNFSVHRGEILTIIGPNASGKSTLLQLLAGLLTPEAGAVLLDGRPVNSLNRRQRAQQIAMVQQESPLLFATRVLPFVLQGRHAYSHWFGFDTDQDLHVAREAMKQTRTLHLADRLMQELSGGEKQRVILARALAQQSELLLLDEPTLHLDIGFQVELLRMVRQLVHQKDFTVILVSHDLNLAAEFGDTALLLHEGRPARYGAADEVFERALLERVFQTELDVFSHPETGRPRVVLRSLEEKKGGAPDDTLN